MIVSVVAKGILLEWLLVPPVVLITDFLQLMNWNSVVEIYLFFLN